MTGVATPASRHAAMPSRTCAAEPKLFFDPSDFAALIADPEVIGLHISPKGRGNQPPIPGSLYAWATEKFATPSA